MSRRPTPPLDARGLGCISIDAEVQTPLNAAILRVMEGRTEAADVAGAHAAVSSIRSAGIDGLILGCTELPFLLPEELGAPEVLDPVTLLAEAAVRHAIAEAG